MAENSWLPINNGRQQSSYREFTITLKPNETHILNNPFNYFRCLEANEKFKLAWSTNNGWTNFQAGLGIKFDDVIPYVQIFNDNAVPLTISVGCGIGYFDDSRLTLSSNVYVKNTNEDPMYTREMVYSQFRSTLVTVTQDGATFRPSAETKKIIIQNINTTEILWALGAALQPYGTFEMNFTGAVTLGGIAGIKALILEYW